MNNSTLTAYLVVMGQLSFYLPAEISAPAREALAKAYVLGGYDLSPLVGQLTVSTHILSVESSEFESGYLAVPWTVKDMGSCTITTATLRGREEPYRLLLELARGKLNQVRNQTQEWLTIGLMPGPGYMERLAELSRKFGKAAVADAAESDALATILLNEIHSLADRLVRTYTEQVFSTRHQQSPRLDTLLSCRFTHRPQTPSREDTFITAFNSAHITPQWNLVEKEQSAFDWSALDNALEWAEAHKLPVTLGPLISLKDGASPAWLSEWHGDLPSLAAFCCDYVEILMARYAGRVKTWHVLDGFNHLDGWNLDDDERLRLAARVLDSCRQIDPEGDFSITVCDPWGTYKSKARDAYSPLVYADTLLRSGLKITCLDLDLSEQDDSVHRDLLDTARLYESFSVLGLPLRVTLGTPQTLPLKIRNRVDNSLSVHDTSISMPIGTLATIGKLHALLSLSVCLPHVRAVTWCQWEVTNPEDPTQMGLDIEQAEGTFAMIDLFTGIRQAHLE